MVNCRIALKYHHLDFFLHHLSRCKALLKNKVPSIYSKLQFAKKEYDHQLYFAPPHVWHPFPKRCHSAKGRWADVAEVAQLALICNKPISAARQCACLLFPAPKFIRVLMDLNVPKRCIRCFSEYMTRLGAASTTARDLPFPRLIPPRQHFMATWKQLAEPLELGPPVSVADPPTSARNRPLQSLSLSWATGHH